MYEDLKVKKKKKSMKRKPAASHSTLTDAQNLKRGRSEVNPGEPVGIIMSGNSISEVAEDAEAERYKNCGGKKKPTRGLQLIPCI